MELGFARQDLAVPHLQLNVITYGRVLYKSDYTHTPPLRLYMQESYAEARISDMRQTYIMRGRPNAAWTLEAWIYVLWCAADAVISHNTCSQSWALSVFVHFFNNKSFFCIFYQVNNLFMHQSYLKSPLPVNELDKKFQKSFFCYRKNFKNTESAQLRLQCTRTVLDFLFAAGKVGVPLRAFSERPPVNF